MKVLNLKKGAVLIACLVIIVIATVYLAGYVIYTNYDQRNMLRHQETEQAAELARAGLNRAIVDLSLDAGSWKDGAIITTGNATCSCCVGNPCPPVTAHPDDFYTLYTETLYTGNCTVVPYGNYTAEIRYLWNPNASDFYDKQVWVRSTGRASTGKSVGGTERILEQKIVYDVP